MPPHENTEYVEKTKQYLERNKQSMQDHNAVFGSRNDRGWVPPTLDDLEAEQQSLQSGESV